NRKRGRHYRVKAHVVVQRNRIDLRGRILALEQRRQRRRESPARRGFGVVQRLDAEPIARRERPARDALVDDEREHAVEALDAPLAPFGIRLQNDLGIARRPEAMPEIFQLEPKLLEVVDATVEDDDEIMILVEHRLRRARRQIEDLQAAMADGDRSLAEVAVRIRPARSEPLGHAFDDDTARVAPIEAELSCYSTHINLLHY